MLKKLVLGALMAGLLGVLVVGAINRTVAKNNQVASTQADQGQGQQQGKNQGQQQGQTANGAETITAADWITYEGIVTTVSADEMVVETSDGTEIIVEGKPWDFAQSAGFSAPVGGAVTLSGYYEDGEFKAGTINCAGCQAVRLRDETGRPGWAGQGRRGG